MGPIFHAPSPNPFFSRSSLSTIARGWGIRGPLLLPLCLLPPPLQMLRANGFSRPRAFGEKKMEEVADGPGAATGGNRVVGG